MSEEKVLTLRGKRAVWAPGGGGSGPIDPKRLPEGYPYKEMGWNTLFEEKAIPIVDQGGGMLGATIETVPLTAGNAYKIVWDGTPYTCIAAEANNGVAVGNLAAVGGAGNGEPFIIATFGTGGSTVGLRSQLIVLEGGAEHTVSISEYSETIHPMAPEFLPAGVGGNDRDFIIDATRGADDTISSKTTFDEVVAAVKSRKVPVLYCDGPDGYLLKNTSHLVYAEGTTVNAVTFQFEHASAGFVIVVEPSGWFIG